MTTREEIRFFGQVQGVGFRYTSKHIGESLGLTGWVYNDYDGSVLMQVQGEKNLIETLIERLKNGRHIEITDMNRKTIPLEEHEYSFEIKDY